MKLNFSIFGNCQAQATRWLLKQSEDFCSKYVEVDIKPSYEMQKDDAFDFCNRVLPHLDLLLMQPHTNKLSHYHCGEFIRKVCIEYSIKLITFPQIYLSIYNPWEKDLNIIDDVADEIRYLDCFMASAVINNMSHEKFLTEAKMLTNARINYISKEHLKCFSYINEIESVRGCDIQLHNWIKSNFKQKRLMHNVNHPNSELMWRIACGIFKNLNIDFIPTIVDLFPDHNTLIYPFVAEAQGIEFYSSDIEILTRYDKYIHFFTELDSVNQSSFIDKIAPYISKDLWCEK